MSEYIITCDDEVATWVGNDVESMKRIVRCMDCRYYEDTGNCNWFECSSCGMLAEVTHDGFCAWGERNA